MTNFRDPAVILRDRSILESLYPTTCGVYIWEYLTTLHYELNFIRGHRPYRWTIWIYSITRVATLMAVIVTLIDLNSTGAINCQILISFDVSFGYLALAGSSLLIVLRVIAIWERNKIIVVISTSFWVANVVLMIRSVVRLRAEWSAVLPGCIVFNSDSSKVNFITSLTHDIVLLLAILVRLLRFRCDGSGTFGLGLLLWKQGVLWLLLSTASGVPPTVLIILNLNDPFNLMFQLPSIVTISIAATRMHRSLTDFASKAADVPSKASKLQWIQTPFNRVQVTADTSNESYQMSRTNHHESSSAYENGGTAVQGDPVIQPSMPIQGAPCGD